MYKMGKVAAVFATIALVFVFMGASYAMWSETLRVNVTINTGEVDVKWSDWSCSDTGIDPGKDKDVGSCTVFAEQTDSEGDVIKLGVVLNNTYPCYYCNVTLIVDNIGTVPVKLYNWTIDKANNTPIDVDLVIPSDTQIDPGLNATYMLNIHVLQSAAENATYTFNVTLIFAQWNEVP